MHAGTTQVSTKMLWTGRIMSAITVLLMLFAAAGKLFKAAAVIEGMSRYGLRESLVLPIGILELGCVIVYVIPQTTVLDAILLTGLLGGATITGLRMGDPTFPIPVLIGMLAWGGLYLRDERLRALIPLRRPLT
jgi:hypothetical protein